jgi:hypothetical protein
MKTYGRVEVWIHVFLTSALVGGELSDSTPATLQAVKEPRIALDMESMWAPEPAFSTCRGE